MNTYFLSNFPSRSPWKRSYTRQSISIYLHKDGEMGYKEIAKDNGKLRILSLDGFLIKCLINYMNYARIVKLPRSKHIISNGLHSSVNKSMHQMLGMFIKNHLFTVESTETELLWFRRPTDGRCPGSWSVLREAEESKGAVQGAESVT